MNVNITNENDRVFLTLTGRLDTTTVSAFEKEIQSLMELTVPDIEMDLSAFDYISSSGLRIFLTLQKKVMACQGKLLIRNMKPEIREVFDMTGFSSIFTIE